MLLKCRDYDKKNIISLSRLIPQNMVLEHEGEAKSATCRNNKLLQTEWLAKEKLSVELKGFDLDTVWENIIVQIGGLTVEQGNTFDEQLGITSKENRRLTGLKSLHEPRNSQRKSLSLYSR